MLHIIWDVALSCVNGFKSKYVVETFSAEQLVLTTPCLCPREMEGEESG